MVTQRPTAGLRHLAALLLRAADANRTAAAAITNGCAACPHLDVMHAYRSNGTRGRCDHTDTAGPCPCGGYTAVIDQEPTV